MQHKLKFYDQHWLALIRQCEITGNNGEGAHYIERGHSDSINTARTCTPGFHRSVQA